MFACVYPTRTSCEREERSGFIFVCGGEQVLFIIAVDIFAFWHAWNAPVHKNQFYNVIFFARSSLFFVPQPSFSHSNLIKHHGLQVQTCLALAGVNTCLKQV